MRMVGILIFSCYCLILLTKEVESTRRRVPDWQIRIAQKQGPNTCAVEEVGNKKFWTECKYWSHREVCGQKTVIRYECCEGFQQIAGRQGCTGVQPIDDLIETTRSLGASIFADQMINSGLADIIKKDGGAHTFFAPTNAAFESLEDGGQPTIEQLKYHVVPHRFHSKVFGPNKMVETVLGPSGGKLRVNRYSNGMLTVNCVPIIRKDQEATDGVVHLIDGFLIPPTNVSWNSVPEVIFYDHRFRELSRLLASTRMVNELRTSSELTPPYTLFAPTDEAFQKLNPEELRRLTADPQAQKALLTNHIVLHPVCPSAITENHKMATLGGGRLELSCDESGSYADNRVNMTGETLLAQNGIVVVVDDLLVPDAVKYVWEITRDRSDLTIFNKLADLAGFTDLLSDRPDDPVTVFAPSDEAFRRSEEEEPGRLDRTDREAALALVSYHTSQGNWISDIITDGQRVNTLDGQHTLRIKVYRKALGVEAAIITESDVMAVGGVLHVIDRVLFPPELSTLDMLRKERNLSLFSDAIDKVQETDPDFMNVFENESITIFAPNDQAFKRMGQKEFVDLMDDKLHLTKMIKNHLVDTMLASGSFQSRLVYRLPTENGQNALRVQKDKVGRLTVNGDARVIKEDMVTKEGIVHFIDKVIVDDQ